MVGDGDESIPWVDADAPTEDDDGSGSVLLSPFRGQEDTLRSWLDRGPHPWADVLEVFEPLGRGLEAAHRAGIVHGVRPEKVALAGEGSVLGTRHDDEHSDATVAEMTAGELLATPAYMSPEQFRGERAGAGADQFSYCVALYEALWGQRPFAGDTLSALGAAVMSGDRREPPPEPEVPDWLARAVLRGLARDPALRFASMSELLAALRPPAEPRRRGPMWIAAGASVVLVAAGATAWVVTDRDTCTAGSKHLVGVWDPPARARVHEALLATGLPYAETTWQRLESQLDDYASQWESTYRSGCQRGLGGDEASRSQRDATMECLQRRREQLEAAVNALRIIDRGSVEHAPELVDALLPADDCTRDPALVRSASPRDPIARAEVEALRRRLAEAQSLRRLGQASAAVQVGRALLGHAERVGQDDLLSAVDLELGRALLDEGSYEDAVVRFDHAVWVGQGIGDPDVVVRASMAMASAMSRQGDASGALRWVHWARKEARDAGLEERLAVELGEAEAEARRAAGDPDGALEALETAVSGHRRSRPDDVLGLGAMLLELARLRGELGRDDGARQAGTEALKILQTELGPEHPRVAAALSRLAAIELMSDGSLAAFEYQQRALRILENAGPFDDARIATAHATLASAAMLSGRMDESDTASRRALEEFQARGIEGPRLVRPLLIRAQTLRAAGRPGEAEELVRRALDVLDTVPAEEVDNEARANAMLVLSTVEVELHRTVEAIAAAEEHVRLTQEYAGPLSEATGRARLNLGTVLGLAQEFGRARDELEAALPVLERTVGSSHSLVATTVNNLSACYRELGQDDEALAMAERTVELWSNRDDVPTDTVGKAHFNLGAAYARVGRRDEAITHYEAAIRFHTESRAPVARDLAEAQFALGQALHDTDPKRAEILLRHARSYFAASESVEARQSVRAIDRLLR
jgi:tetratricopeptide (TPR) repeat protein